MRTSTRPEHRLDWRTGQLLGHADLTDWAAYEPELLALHSRAAHATWGIAEGLDVARTADLRALAVSSGLGFTCRGRLLGLARDTITAPPGSGSGTFILALRLPATPAGECQPTPLCADLGTRERTRPTARLVWQPVQVGPRRARCEPPDDELPLARVRRGADGRLDPPDPAVRRFVAPAVRPRIAHGAVTGDTVHWVAVEPVTLAAFIAADTGFDTAPRFFPSVHGALLPAGTLGPWPHVGWASASAFEFRLGFAAASGSSAQDIIERVLPRLAQATLSWIAVERIGPCASAPTIGGAGVFPANVLPLAPNAFRRGGP